MHMGMVPLPWARRGCNGWRIGTRTLRVSISLRHPDDFKGFFQTLIRVIVEQIHISPRRQDSHFQRFVLLPSGDGQSLVKCPLGLNVIALHAAQFGTVN